MALNRKFSLEYIERDDIVPLTELAARSTGLPSYNELLERVFDDSTGKTV